MKKNYRTKAEILNKMELAQNDLVIYDLSEDLRHITKNRKRKSDRNRGSFQRKRQGTLQILQTSQQEFGNLWDCPWNLKRA